MENRNPAPGHIPGLRRLWKEAFGDTDAFLDVFFGTAFSPDRCMCAAEEDQVNAALYWFDCHLDGRKYAYIYAVATAKSSRGQGLCHRLMDAAHSRLRETGYAGALLVPQEASLRRFYGGMGYRDAGGTALVSAAAGDRAASLRAIGREEFALRRRALLPEGGLIQEGENLLFLEQQVRFFAGDGFLLAAWEDKGVLHGEEYLGDPAALPGILKALDCREGTFRMPGREPFAMFLPLTEDAAPPAYFGFCFM